MYISRLIRDRIGLEESGSRLFRRRRFEAFLQLVDRVLLSQDVCRIVDFGGEERYWANLEDMIGDRKLEVTMVNPVPSYSNDSRFLSIYGDARDMSAWQDNSFDIVHSNSVIEHVGLWADMKSMAREVRRLAPSYFVQTPYYWFPIEPHCSTAFFHWMPPSIRLSMLMGKKRGIWGRAKDVDTAMGQIHSAILLDQRMLQALFPDSEIRRERVAGLTKSLIAVRQPPRTPDGN